MLSQLVLASLALGVRSVLIPPNVAVTELGDDRAIETLAIDPFRHTVSLDCPGCPVAEKKDGALMWGDKKGTSYSLDFQIGQNDRENQEILTIDGVQLYPPSFDNFARPFFVKQTAPRDDDELKGPPSLRVTGYTFHFNSAQTVTEGGSELLPMTFKITSIENQKVTPPVLTIYLLKDIDGRLMIANFQTAQADDSSPTEQKVDKECKNFPLLCKWKAIVADKFDSMKKGMGKGCHRHKGGKFNPMEHPDIHGKPPHRFRPGDKNRPHHFTQGPGHHGHHHHHGIHMFLRRAFFTVILPILVGVIAGSLTYLIGLSLGYGIAFVITKFSGRSYQRVAQDEDEEEQDMGGDNGKEVYSELPAYEEAPPVYEEATEKEVVTEPRQ